MEQKPNSYNADYGGIKTTHTGGWSPAKYHSHQDAHPDKLRQTSEKRSMKPIRKERPVSDVKPKTRVLDLSTGKEIQNAVKKDLANRGIHPSKTNESPN